MVTTPVPPILDVNRYAVYNPTSATTDFALNFPLFGDATDILVFYNKSQLTLTTDYTVLSASTGANLTPIPVADAFVRLTSAVSTGVVEIYGNWRPRRTIQASAPYSTRDFNVVFSQIIAGIREIFSSIYRSIKVPPGDNEIVIPPKSTRANTYFAFDASGNAVFIAAPSVIGSSSIQMWQFRKALSIQGQLYSVINSISADPNDPICIAWTSGATVSSGDLLYAWVQSTLSYTGTQMTALMNLAKVQTL